MTIRFRNRFLQVIVYISSIDVDTLLQESFVLRSPSVSSFQSLWVVCFKSGFCLRNRVLLFLLDRFQCLINIWSFMFRFVVIFMISFAFLQSFFAISVITCVLLLSPECNKQKQNYYSLFYKHSASVSIKEQNKRQKQDLFPLTSTFYHQLIYLTLQPCQMPWSPKGYKEITVRARERKGQGKITCVRPTSLDP